MNFRRLSARCRLTALLVLGAGAVRGHDPLQSYTDARLRGDYIVVNVTMANSAATELLKKDNAAGNSSITPENFEQTGALLKAHAGDLLNITAGGNTIAMRAGDVTLNSENDIEFKLVFPRPPSGTIKFEAPFIKELQEGHMTSYTIADDANKILDSGELSALDRPNTLVNVPGKPGPASVATVSAAPPVPAASAIPSAPPPPATFLAPVLWGALALAGLAGAGWLLHRRQSG